MGPDEIAEADIPADKSPFAEMLRMFMIKELYDRARQIWLCGRDFAAQQ